MNVRAADCANLPNAIENESLQVDVHEHLVAGLRGWKDLRGAPTLVL